MGRAQVPGAIRRAGRRLGWLACLLALTGVWAAPAKGAQDPLHSADRFQSWLETGEFGPAMKWASEQPPAERDQLLARIATAQAQAGARRASAWSLSRIESDQVAHGALDEIARGSRGAAGGAALADFDTLIELITSTIAPDTWDAVGGPGAIEPFPTGVYVDSQGLMRHVELSGSATELEGIRIGARPAAELPASQHRTAGDVRRRSPLRKVSLNRLERQLRMRHVFGMGPDDAMKNLAGLHRVEYVLLYPESGDVVLAGPADDWQKTVEGRIVSRTTGEPVLRLDDLIVLLRNAEEAQGRFGCAIVPRTENLAQVQAFLAKWSGKPLRAGQKEDWLAELRGHLGKQDITLHGVDPRTRVAHLIVEADYHMKLVGIGLEEGTLGVDSYLESLPAQHPAGSMQVLRWWFTLRDRAIETTPDRLAFQWKGSSVQVLSENELLAKTGERIHTGKSDDLNRQFAHSFTQHYEDLCKRYPVYADLRNVFDLALVTGLLKKEGVADELGWHANFFLDPAQCSIGLSEPPKEIESVMNHRDLNRETFIVGVSGGVAVDASQWIGNQDHYRVVDDGYLRAARNDSQRTSVPAEAWWWD